MKKGLSNRYAFGLGTIGRDMVYTMISMYLLFFMTDVLTLKVSTLWWISAIILATRVFDALNDPIMGVIVDNTHTKIGKFKPWIAAGAIGSGIFTVLMFLDFGAKEEQHIIIFALSYLFWEITFTMNDIAYWSMLPSLSTNQKEREKIGAFARICANIGLFFVVTGIVPITKMLGDSLGGLPKGYLAFAAMIVVVMLIGQCITFFGVKESIHTTRVQEQTTFKDMFGIIFKNDQLLVTAVSMTFFTIGYMTTTSFGLYFFKYAYGNEAMYSAFALILGISQITALIIFPLVSRKLKRKQFYLLATVLVVTGYLIFFFAPMSTMLFIGIGGILIFVGEAFIQLLMLMFLADAVEYGQWKLRKRNDSVTFSIQPFINKMGGAIASGVVSVVIIISGIVNANSASDVSSEALVMMKTAMLIFPLICITIGYLIYQKGYIIDEKMYASILEDLKDRGDI